jgi:hypothetical protein
VPGPVRPAARCAALAVAGALGAALATALIAGPSDPAGAATGAEPRVGALRETASDLRTQLRRERARHDRALARARREGPRIRHAFRLAAAAYGVPEERLRRVAECESRLEPDARNGIYLGLFQFGAPLWSRTPFGAFERSDPYAAALAASWAFSRGLSSHWPVCGRS